MSLNDTGRFSETSLLILASLAGGPKHGYAMMEDIQEMSGIRLGPGTLYAAIVRLEEQGLIQALPSGDRRKPYQLTGLGAKTLEERLKDVQSFTVQGLERLRIQI
ncbi:PadR family transcriptional regulator [Candidatus Cryosericum odellii]|uniref:PadR family transcriptional regulator n=1 Tax=Candidatus Cryosericum odellii TaxID=2290917 RepID=A0A398CZX4_9BACT|nr:PadR family transcriptional regulator [Candidatus Cryosericum odellii]